MVALWWEEAERNQVLPLDNRSLWALDQPQARSRRRRTRFRYFQGGAQVPEAVAVNVRNRSHAITVEVEVEDGTVPDGVLVALGSALGGWSLTSSAAGCATCTTSTARAATSSTPTTVVGQVATPSVRIRKGRRRQALGARGGCSSTARWWPRAHINRFTPSGFNGVGVGLTCGYEWGPAVGRGTRRRSPSTAASLRAVVTTTGPVVRDPLAEIAAILAEQ